MDKNQAFEYYVVKLLEWHKEVVANSEENDLSTLKVLKLLFFGCAINTQKGLENTLLDFPFNKFYAMPYGHVESEIYNSIRRKEFKNISIDNFSAKIDNQVEYHSDPVKNQIDESINKLKEINIDLIKMTSFELVELSHLWYSWKFYFDKAKKNGSYSELIPTEIIKSEQKFYYL